MKKSTISKKLLKVDTVKPLTQGDLTRVAGALPTNELDPGASNDPRKRILYL